MMHLNQRRLLLTSFLLFLQRFAFVSSYAFHDAKVRRSTSSRNLALTQHQNHHKAEEQVIVQKQQQQQDSPTPNKTGAGGDVDLESLPPVLRDLVVERREFQINLGRAMDTLRKDYESILVKKPDFSIYHPEIRAVDPSGTQLEGLDKYKSAFAFFQTFLGFWFSLGSSSIQFRMVYDDCQSAIRISWNAVLVPKLLGSKFYVDGVSYYRMDVPSGKIIEHKIENLIMNNAGVEPPYGILSLLQQDALRLVPQGGGGVPTGGIAAIVAAAAAATTVNR